MPNKYLFALPLMFVMSAGCMLDHHAEPNVVAVPPYLQSKSQLEQSQLEEMQAFHKKESAKMADEMHVIRNHEMARMESAGKELEKDKRRQEDYDKTQEQRTKWTSWTSWFKKDKKTGKSEAATVSSRSHEGVTK